jgi:hypothetical protein
VQYREAVLAVLEGGHAFPVERLKAELRSVLGFARTGAELVSFITAAVDGLLADGVVGQGSMGIRRKQ